MKPDITTGAVYSDIARRRVNGSQLNVIDCVDNCVSTNEAYTGTFIHIHHIAGVDIKPALS